MTFRQFAFHNVFRNKRLYMAYFLSSMFTVMVFFTFANFAFHPLLTGDEMNMHVTQGLMVAGGIIYVFSFFFILYSMSSFLQSRKREFGLLMMQGMSHGQIRLMVFLENMLIGFFAIVMGIGFGLAFSKLILLVAENLLELEGALHFYFPVYALVLTFFSFLLLFFFISLFVTFVLRTNKLVKLIKGDKIGKSEPKASLWLTILAVLLLGCGYGIALIVEGVQVVVALFPVVILVITGTYFLFTQVSVFVIRRLKSNRFVFWKNTNMLLFSDLSHRMKDNARAFFMVAIISTVAFSAIGTLVGFNAFISKGIVEANPASFSYYLPDDEDTIPDLEAVFEKHDLLVEDAEVSLAYFDQGGESVMITTPDMYNSFARLFGEKEITLDTDEVIAVEQSDANLLTESGRLEDTSITLADGTEKKVDEASLGMAKKNVLPSMNRYFIVSEDVYEQLPEPEWMETNAAWQVVDGSKEDEIAAGLELEKMHPGLMGVEAAVYEIHKYWSPIMFVGLFIGIVFFVSAGSFLYFRLYTDLDEDKAKFAAISKIGLTKGEMNRVISKQMALLFFAPIIVAILHGTVALTALSRMFKYSLWYESIFVLGSFLVIQILYFVIVRYFYTRQIRRHVLG